MTKKILLIKTSSLGDVIHALPAVTDLKVAGAAARIDWVVEEPLVAIARLHPGVDDTIPVAIRRWRGVWWRGAIRDEVRACKRRLQAATYDAVIDAQGLFKSALIALAARGTRHGLDFHSSREPLALFYQHTYRIPWDLHAVERTRLLAARALGYAVPPRCDYGIRAAARNFEWLPAPGGYAVLLHASSGDYKLWDEENWMTLGSALNAAGMPCVLPWGNARERERSVRIANCLRAAVVPPALSLDDLAGLLAGGKAVVGVDTGLTHLAAALGVPTVGIYSATDPAATGIYGCAHAANVGGIGRVPSALQVIAAVETLLA
jgi:heptosyltransferase-1